MTMGYLVIKKEFENLEILRFENHSLFILTKMRGWFYGIEILKQVRNDKMVKILTWTYDSTELNKFNINLQGLENLAG